MKYLDILSKKNIVTPELVDTIEESLAVSEENSLDKILAEKGVTKEEILKAKEEFFNLPFRDLSVAEFSNKILKYVPEKSALHYKFIPLGIVDNFLEIGIVDPSKIEARDAIQFISSKVGLPFKLFVITEDDFELLFEGYRGLRGEVSQVLDEFELELTKDEEEISKELNKIGKHTKQETVIKEDAPITKMVAIILKFAHEGDASDIHIEPVRDKVQVRFRVDGVLDVHLILPTKVHQAVVARIKILAKMRLDEKRKPQDGRFTAMVDKSKIDFRVSTFPSYYGEKVVMRLLESNKGVTKLEDTGLSKKHLEVIRRGIKRDHGLILISGPTGSGKTTTLYAILNEVDRLSKNVLSLEDPVEKNVEGVSQSQVRPEIGYTFASGLRTILRQDPDIIMVGEIRDKETAALAIQAALTGHLVLSTIHTNDAVGVVPRLVEMGVDPFLIAPTLIISMAQRLTRKLAEGSGKALPVKGSIKMIIDKTFEGLPDKFKKDIVFPEFVYEATPTENNPEGLKGRTGIYEVLEIDSDIEEIILTSPDSVSLEKIVREKGMMTMKEDGFLKAFKKIIPFAEANKF
ncbi:MAG: type II/IV secretion system protein [Candidatus Pacebacteria bacterium]|nr:type II/IV secretion system protein [Candidatus Paceibacterota bacterium]